MFLFLLYTILIFLYNEHTLIFLINVLKNTEYSLLYLIIHEAFYKRHHLKIFQPFLTVKTNCILKTCFTICYFRKTFQKT